MCKIVNTINKNSQLKKYFEQEIHIKNGVVIYNKIAIEKQKHLHCLLSVDAISFLNITVSRLSGNKY